MVISATESIAPPATLKLSLHSLRLNQFRNFDSHIIDITGKSAIITGNNGIGKTNILEAISLLMPGRGLRGAKLAELQRQPIEGELGWGVSAKLMSGATPIHFATGQQADRIDKRIVKIDGENLKAQATLAEHFAVLWQTPQMDGLFSSGQGERRRFFDKICGVFLPHHSSQVAKYDYLRRERSKVLAHNGDDTWLRSLEKKMAEATLSIAASRSEMLEALQYSIGQLHPAFPRASLSLQGFAEQALEQEDLPAIEIELQISQQLERSRVADAQSGRASHGAHKTELEVIFSDKGVEAAYCSTGEQKALMLSLLLAQAQALKERQQRLPILLLDEVVAHLDESRRQALFDTISELNCQSWMTGTDKALFNGFKDGENISI